MNIGVDIHGVISRYPFLFKKLTELWATEGYRIHIVTGKEWATSEPEVKKAGITYHEHFSIVDNHKNIGTEMWEKPDHNGFWMEDEIWNKSKGGYAEAWNLGIHFDDSKFYGQYFPNSCTYIQVPKYDFDKICEKILGLDLTCM